MYGFLRFVQVRCTNLFIFFFLDFEIFYYLVGLIQIFEVKSRPCPNRIFKFFVGYVAPSKTHILRDILCKNVFLFLNIAVIYEFMGLGIDRDTGSGRAEPPKPIF